MRTLLLATVLLAASSVACKKAPAPADEPAPVPQPVAAAPAPAPVPVVAPEAAPVVVAAATPATPAPVAAKESSSAPNKAASTRSFQRRPMKSGPRVSKPAAVTKASVASVAPVAPVVSTSKKAAQSSDDPWGGESSATVAKPKMADLRPYD